MKFRDMEIDDVLVIGPFAEKLFLKKLKELNEKYIIIDLQYGIINSTPYGHSALVLVKNKSKKTQPSLEDNPTIITAGDEGKNE